MRDHPIHLAIFASGSGSNALRIIKYFSASLKFKIALIISNNKNAGVLAHAPEHQIPHFFWPKNQLSNSEKTLELLNNFQIDGIILAGFLAKIPEYLVNVYQDKILNIHPALLPAFGGIGMHGMYVHQAVSQAAVSVTGPTMHVVNEDYDAGRIIFQCRVPIAPKTSADEIAQQVLRYEHKFYPYIIERYFRHFCSKSDK